MVIWDGHVFIPKEHRFGEHSRKFTRQKMFGMDFYGEMEEYQIIEAWFKANGGKVNITQPFSGDKIAYKVLNEFTTGGYYAFLVTKKNGLCVCFIRGAEDIKESVILAPISIGNLRAVFDVRMNLPGIKVGVKHLNKLESIKKLLVDYDLVYTETCDLVVDI